jgi:hypothetical protein
LKLPVVLAPAIRNKLRMSCLFKSTEVGAARVSPAA